jgi:sister-chromatid-cohesion protein PDS5
MDNAGVSEHEATKSDEFMKYLAGKNGKTQLLSKDILTVVYIGHFPEKARTLNALRSFLSRESEKDAKLLKNAIDLNRTYKQVYTAKDKLLSSLNDDQSGILEIFQAILNRACPLILNRSIVPHLLKLSRSTKGRRRSATSKTSLIAQEILKEISATYPAMYTTNMNDIINEIMTDNDATGNYRIPCTLICLTKVYHDS